MSKFCSKCGKEFSDDAVFCGYCGTRFQDSGRADAPVSAINKKLNLNTKNIVILIISVTVMLIMLIMPMHKLIYDKYDPTDYYTVTMLEDNYMAGHGCKDTINSVSKIVFVGLLGSFIGLNYFNITKKYKNTVLVSVINFIVFLVYNFFVLITWIRDANPYWRDDYSFAMTPGCFLCYVLFIAMIVCSLSLFKPEKRKMMK